MIMFSVDVGQGRVIEPLVNARGTDTVTGLR